MSGILFEGMDPDDLVERIVTGIEAAIRDGFAEASSHPKLVDRETMAELPEISLSTLDRFVGDHSIPSVLIGTRRFFEPRRVIDALSQQSIVKGGSR